MLTKLIGSVRRNHALEHATISILVGRLPRHATSGGPHRAASTYTAESLLQTSKRRRNRA
jgi:hypothetical protein